MAMFGTTQGNINVPAGRTEIVGSMPNGNGPGQGERTTPSQTNTTAPNGSIPIK